MAGVTLDAGALIAIERGDRRMQALLDEAHSAGFPIDIPAGPLAQAWRSGPRQARLARTLHLPYVSVPALDEQTAKAAGILCGQRATHDPIDASVVLNARRRDQTVVTSDPDDLRQLDPSLRIMEIQRSHKPGGLGYVLLGGRAQIWDGEHQIARRGRQQRRQLGFVVLDRLVPASEWPPPGLTNFSGEESSNRYLSAEEVAEVAGLLEDETRRIGLVDEVIQPPPRARGDLEPGQS